MDQVGTVSMGMLLEIKLTGKNLHSPQNVHMFEQTYTCAFLEH